MKRIYLDYNATTPIAPAVQERMLPFLAEYFGNPSSSHVMGRICQEAMEDARSLVASSLGAVREEIVFTSGGTESNNLAIFGVMLNDHLAEKGHLIVSAIEHPATHGPAAFLERQGFSVTTVPCDGQGVVDPHEIERAIRPNTRLVSVMHANNEVGTLQPIAEIGEVCRSRDVLLHTDAAQSFGKVRVNVRELNVDLLSIAGHKVYSPKGIGALYIRKGVKLDPILFGANHERGLRPGTENVASIVGLGCAAELAYRSLDESTDRLARLRDSLLGQLQSAIPEELVVNGFRAERLPNTLSVALPRCNAHRILEAIPELCASTGSACHSGSGIQSATLSSMGVSEKVANGTIRLSIGWYTTESEISSVASLLGDEWSRQR